MTADEAAPAVRPGAAPNARRRAALSSYLGGVLEWYDFYLYTAASALLFNKLFFPSFDPVVGTIVSFGTFGAGWLVRPIGGLIAGHFGDRFGRKRILLVTFYGMGVASVLIGVLPTYAQIGVWAPVLLILLRLAQGFSAGGEYAASALMVIEHAPARRRALYGSVVSASTFSGVFLANLALIVVSQLLPGDAFLAWGWRLPFLASFVLFLITWWARSRISETPVFEETTTVSRFPLRDLFRTNRRVVLLSITLYLGAAALGSFYATTLVAYAVQIGFTRDQTLLLTMLTSVVGGAAVVAWAAASDRIGRLPVLLVCTIVPAALMFLVFPLYDSGVLGLALLGLTLLVAFQPGFTAVFPTALAEMFPTTERYTGMSLSYQVTGAIGSGLSPIITSTILLWSGGPPHTLWVSVFLVAAAALSVVGLLLVGETRQNDLATLQQHQHEPA